MPVEFEQIDSEAELDPADTDGLQVNTIEAPPDAAEAALAAAAARIEELRQFYGTDDVKEGVSAETSYRQAADGSYEMDWGEGWKKVEGSLDTQIYLDQLSSQGSLLYISDQRNGGTIDRLIDVQLTAEGTIFRVASQSYIVETEKNESAYDEVDETDTPAIDTVEFRAEPESESTPEETPIETFITAWWQDKKIKAPTYTLPKPVDTFATFFPPLLTVESVTHTKEMSAQELGHLIETVSPGSELVVTGSINPRPQETLDVTIVRVTETPGVLEYQFLERPLPASLPFNQQWEAAPAVFDTPEQNRIESSSEPPVINLTAAIQRSLAPAPVVTARLERTAMGEVSPTLPTHEPESFDYHQSVAHREQKTPSVRDRVQEIEQAIPLFDHHVITSDISPSKVIHSKPEIVFPSLSPLNEPPPSIDTLSLAAREQQVDHPPVELVATERVPFETLALPTQLIEQAEPTAPGNIQEVGPAPAMPTSRAHELAAPRYQDTRPPFIVDEQAPITEYIAESSNLVETPQQTMRQPAAHFAPHMREKQVLPKIETTTPAQTSDSEMAVRHSSETVNATEAVSLTERFGNPLSQPAIKLSTEGMPIAAVPSGETSDTPARAAMPTGEASPALEPEPLPQSVAALRHEPPIVTLSVPQTMTAGIRQSVEASQTVKAPSLRPQPTVSEQQRVPPPTVQAESVSRPSPTLGPQAVSPNQQSRAQISSPRSGTSPSREAVAARNGRKNITATAASARPARNPPRIAPSPARSETILRLTGFPQTAVADDTPSTTRVVQPRVVARRTEQQRAA